MVSKVLGLITLAFGIFLAALLYGTKTQTHAVVGDVTIDQSTGGTSAFGNVTFQKLTDTANSAYFIDPAATGDSLVTAGKVTAGSFAGDGSLLTGISGIPAGLVSFFNLASCPSGWTELTAARGRVVVGLPLSGTLAGTVGTALTNLEDRAHTHTGPSHTHSQNMGGVHSNVTIQGTVVAYGANNNDMYNTPSSGGSSPTVVRTGVQASGTDATSAISATPPYIQLLACQKS